MSVMMSNQPNAWYVWNGHIVPDHQAVSVVWRSACFLACLRTTGSACTPSDMLTTVSNMEGLRPSSRRLRLVYRSEVAA
jgi:hypothetical protein